MPTIKDKRTGKTYEVSDADALNYARTDPNFEIVGSLQISPSAEVAGGQTLVTDPTAHAVDVGERSAHWKSQSKDISYNNPIGEVKSFIGGGIETLSAGLWKPWEEEQEVNPGASIVGQIAGFVPGLFTGGAEANLARKGVQLGAEAITAGKALTRLEKVGAAVRRAYEFTAPGIATRAGRAVEAFIPGATAGARIARSAANAAAFSTTDEALRQALDSDKEFSGEQLLHAAGWGAVLGGGGAAASEGIGIAKRGISKYLSKEAQQIDEAAKLLEHRPSTSVADDAVEWGPRVDLSKSAGGIKVRDSIAQLRKDVESLKAIAKEATNSPGLAKAAGIESSAIAPLVDDANKAMRNLEKMMMSDAAPIQQLSRQLHSVDDLAQRLKPFSNELPKRWTDGAVRSKFYGDMEARLSKLPKDVDPNLIAGERLAAHLAVGAPESAAVVRDGVIGWIGKKVLGEKVGRAVSGIADGGGKAGLIGLGGILLGEHLVDGAAASIVGGGLKLAALGVGAKLGAKAIQLAFRDPAIGGLIAGSTVSVLNRAHVLPGSESRRETDPRRALRGFADRTRRVTPEQVASKAAASLSHVAGATPLSVAAAAETAGRRHAQIMAILDREDPISTGPLGRQLPTVAAAKRVADVVRVTATPNNVVMAALNGTLTPTMLAAAEDTYPATVARLRQALLAQLAMVEDPTRLPAKTRRLISMLLGPSAGGDQANRLAYRSAMDKSAQRTREGYAPTQAKPPADPPKSVAENRLSTPAQRAAHPAGGR